MLWVARWAGVVVGLLQGLDSVLRGPEPGVVVEVVLRGLRFGCRLEGEGRMVGVEDFVLWVEVVRLVEEVARMMGRD